MREDWEESTLGEICNVNMGQSPPSSTYNTEGVGLPFFQGKAEFTDLYPTVKKWCSEPKKVAKENDILLSVRAPVGSTNMSNQECAIGRGLAAITYSHSTQFVWYFLKLIEKELDSQGTGTTFRAISGNILRSQIFPLAPLPEQRAIVAKIEELFSDLDKGIADLKRAQAQLKVYRQAVLKKAFEGELTKAWREQQTNLPTADTLLEQIKEERQKHYEQQLEHWKQAVKAWEENGKEGKKPSKPKIIKALPALTKDELESLPTLNKFWKWSTIDNIAGHEASSLKAGPFGSSLKKSFYTEIGYKIYGQEQVISGDYTFGNYYVNEEKFQSLINCAIAPFDILISLVGTVGKVLVLPEDCEKGIINPRLVKVTLNRFYEPVFFKYYFESSFLKSLYKLKNHGTTMDVLNLGSIKELPYPICSKGEQNQIVQEIESRLSVCDKVEQSITESLNKAQALRQSILKKAFAGDLLSKEALAACKAAPDYEPASVLLAKIKAEKKI